MHSALHDELKLTFQNVLDSNWFVLGNYLETFEQEYARFNNVNFTVGVSNGLDALHLAMSALDIGAEMKSLCHPIPLLPVC